MMCDLKNAAQRMANMLAAFSICLTGMKNLASSPANRNHQGCRHLRGRRAGSTLYLDVKIEVDPFCSVSTAYQIGETVRYQIQNSHPEVSEVFIHLEPATKHSQPTMVAQQEGAEVTYDSNNTASEDNWIEEMITDMLTSKFSEFMDICYKVKIEKNSNNSLIGSYVGVEFHHICYKVKIEKNSNNSLTGGCCNTITSSRPNQKCSTTNQRSQGSPTRSSTIENDGASNLGFGLDPSLSPTRAGGSSAREVSVSVRSFKKEEVESKITVWKNAKIAEINNRLGDRAGSAVRFTDEES